MMTNRIDKKRHSGAATGMMCLVLAASACSDNGADKGSPDGGRDPALTGDSDADSDSDTDTGVVGDTDVVPSDAIIETVVQGPSYSLLEGPVWDMNDTLYFSDIDNNLIYQYTGGAVTRFRTNSNGTNGLMFDRSGRLCCCEGGAGRLTALDASGNVAEVLTDSYNGSPYNRPNDLIIDRHGGIYFTDPTWDMSYPQPVQGVYYRDSGGTVTLLISDMNKPNGIMLNPAQDTLYVGDWDDRYVRAYDVTGPGQLANQRNFAELVVQPQSGNSSGADGMAMDTSGNLYVATNTGIQIYSASGRYIDTLEVQGSLTNCTFGGDDMRTLFVTERQGLYRVTLNIPGIQFPR